MIIQPFIGIPLTLGARLLLASRILSLAIRYTAEDLRNATRGSFITGAQTLTYFLVGRPLCLIRNITSDIEIPHEGRFVVFANHTFALDPLYVFGSLRWKEFRKLLPIRSLAKNVFFERTLSAVLYRIMGCFPAHRTNAGEGGVKGALQLVDRHETILIFPEGRVQKWTKGHSLKPGLGRIGLSRNVTILPLRITPGEKHRVSDVTWLEPIPSNTLSSQDAEAATKELFSAIDVT